MTSIQSLSILSAPFSLSPFINPNKKKLKGNSAWTEVPYREKENYSKVLNLLVEIITYPHMGFLIYFVSYRRTNSLQNGLKADSAIKSG